MQAAIVRFLEQAKIDGRAANTLDAYGRDLRQFSVYLHTRFPLVQVWADVQSAHSAAFFTHLGNSGRSPSTLARKRIAIGRFFAHLGLQLDATLAADTPSGTTKAKATSAPPLSQEQIVRLLAEAARTPTATASRDRALLELLCVAEMQLSELVGLTLADLNLDVGEIVCAAGCKRQRTVSLNSSVAAALADYLGRGRGRLLAAGEPQPAAEQPLFLNQRGQRLTRQGVWLIVRTHAAAVGLEDLVSPRALRRTTLTSAQDGKSAESSLTLDGVLVVRE